MLPEPPPPDLHQAIRALLLAARAQVRQTVNTAMVQTYWHIGRMIVEDEQLAQYASVLSVFPNSRRTAS